MAASPLFDGAARREWASLFVCRDGHHMLFARVGGVAAGFISGVEMTHPDKGTEMLLYELGVAPEYRRQGVGRALVLALRQLAIDRGCYGMWVGTDDDNAAAIATYRSASAGPPEPAIILTWNFNAEDDGPTG